MIAIEGGETSEARASRAGRGNRVAIAIAMAAAVLLIGALAVQLRRPLAGPSAGRAAPPFVFATFDGRRIDLDDLRGEVIVLNFWASWCVSCVYEAGDLEAVWRDYGDRGVTVLGVAYNDTRPAAMAYLERLSITYPNGMDPGGAISQAYRLRGVPETVVIDARGNVVPLHLRNGERPVAKLVGPITSTSSYTPEDLRATLDRLLEGGPTG